MARKKAGAKSAKKRRVRKYARAIGSKSRSRRSVTGRSIGPGGVSPSSVPNNSIVTIPKGFPLETRTKLCYSDLADSLTSATPGYYTNARFRMNDPTDPDETGVGSQPPLFDNLRAIYSAWRVNSCKVVCDVENYTNFPLFLTLVGLYDGTSNPTSPANPSTYDLMALPTTVRSARKRINTVQVGNGNKCTISKTFYPEDIVGQDYFSSVNFQGGASSPTKIAFIDLIAQVGSGSGSAVVGAWLSWRIEYDISFFDENALEIAAYD